MAAEHSIEHVVSHATEAQHDMPEISNIITILAQRCHGHPLVSWLHRWENMVFAAIIALVISLIAWKYGRKPATIPEGGQNLVELFVEGTDRFIHSIIGKTARQHVPFIGTLFLYIWFMNLSVLVPGFKSATSSLNTTVGLACAVFFYVQGVAIKSNGIVGYLDHLAGQPRDVVGWVLSPLMFLLHLIGEFVRPVSLSLRLCFNIFAEDIFLAVLVGMGISLGLAMHLPIGIPLQVLVLPLILIFSTVQALVFSLLSAVYIALMLPHEAHGEHH